MITITYCIIQLSFADQNPTAQALNVYSLLLERQGLIQMSVKAASRCVTLAEQHKTNSGDDGDKNLRAYRSNYARILW